MYLLSVNMIQKKRCMIFDSGMMTHEESHVLRWLKNMLDIRLGCASICKRVVGHISLGVFFWRCNISFRFGQFVSLLTEAIFSFNFWETASIV